MSGTETLLWIYGMGILCLFIGAIGTDSELAKRIERLERTLREHGIEE